jgi:glycosyltransferase involved in cell wall biosynthesis
MQIVQVPRRFVAHEWGGTETVILETSKRLIARGHRTEIVCPNALSDIPKELVQSVPVRRMPYFYPYFGLNKVERRMLDKKGGNLFSFELMRYLERSEGLDLIHLHTGKRLGGIVRHVALRRHLPYVMTLHGGVFDVPADEAASWTEPTKGTLEWGKVLGAWVGARSVLDDAAAILCVGAAERDEVARRYPKKRVEHLPNGVDTVRFATGNGCRFREKHDIPGQARLIVTVGRIDPQKNQRLALDVLCNVLATAPDAHLALIGPVTNAAYLQELRTDAAQRGVEKHLTIITGIPSDSQDLVDCYHAADVFLLPSRHEPFGIVVLEAWAAGAAVVASRVGGIPSFVGDGTDALLFTPGDAAEGADLVRRILDSEELRLSLGSCGRAKARYQYDWDAVTVRLIAIYEDVIRANTVR